MSDVADRFRKVAAAFSQRASALTADEWDAPSPCEGWVARDIVRHMVAWMPSYVLGAPISEIPSVDRDPRGGWETMREAIQSSLDGGQNEEAELAVAQFVIGDVLIHTWDLARATGQDESLDVDEVRRALKALSGVVGSVLDNGHFAPSVDVPETADDQTKLLAITGRRAASRP